MSDSPSPSPAFEPTQDSIVITQQEDSIVIQKAENIDLTILD